MHKTSTINLSGQLFNIDEDAYRLLKTYLDRLREQLKNDDDRDEIMQDFEQAIAEHFMDALPSKDKAVTVALVNRVTKTIGDYEPTEAAESEEKADDDGWRKHFRRTLYLNKDDAIIAGVCGGIARALDVDSFWIRVLFVILVFATSGFMIVIYIILSFIMLDPAETTPLFKRNGKPLTASALVANSKQRFHETRETLKLELPDSITLHDLRQRINEPSPSSVHLSLNRKDELLAPSPDHTLRSLGVTSGDLIYYSLVPSAFAASLEEIALASSSEVKSQNEMGIGFAASDVDMHIQDPGEASGHAPDPMDVEELDVELAARRDVEDGAFDLGRAVVDRHPCRPLAQLASRFALHLRPLFVDNHPAHPSLNPVGAGSSKRV